jgi:hypothetical protein
MKKFILILSILTCYAVSGFCATSCADRDSENFMEKCAVKIIEDHIYLKPGCVFVSENDIFIKIDNDIVPLEAIYCDENGVYVYDYQLSSLVYCNECHRRYDPKTQSVICPHLQRPKK